MVSGMVRPPISLPATGKRLDGDPIVWRESIGTHHQLDKGKVQDTAMRDSMTRSGDGSIARIRAIEERIQNMRRLQFFLPFLRPTMILATLEAEQMTRQEAILRDQEITPVFAILRITQVHPGAWTESKPQGFAGKR